MVKVMVRLKNMAKAGIYSCMYTFRLKVKY